MLDLGTLLTAPVLADWDGPGWWIVFVPLSWFLVIVALIFLVRVFVFRGGRWGPGWGGGPGGPRPEGGVSATDVLERRFAEGELSADEYRERLAVLAERPPPG
jgi:putative membrane protein